jgi:hypothetical protein
MATLVLTVVGGIIGGPVGAAIGATIGQAVDRDVLFKPKGRQGPRLSDLSVQTSSYGTQIPKVFGTMRVAGCVFWSTDLIESRSTQSGGKGQPSLTSYSYAVSFAVLLSARPIAGVGRIWADGNLLRGSAGDFKTATGFRLCLGGEDQAADPLIASAEGLGLTPAARGMAYAVFENFQLADYGNRIPSLTFELLAGDAALTIGSVAAALSAGLVSGGGAALTGVSAYGDSVRGVLETLGAADGSWFAADGDALVLRDLAVADATLGDDGSMAADDAPGRKRTIAAIESVPRAITLAYYDPARDYQIGVQRALRPGPGTAEQRIDLPATMAAGAAKALAETALARAEAGRETRTVKSGWAALGIAPGACIAITGAAGLWRVSGWSLEKMVLALDCVRLAEGTAATVAADPGRAASAPDAVIGATILHAFEIPPLDDSLLAAPRLTIAAAGTGAGWRSAALLYSLDGGASWIGAGATAAPAVIGTIVTPPGIAGAAIRDLRSIMEVELAHDGMNLAGADDAALDHGANIALAGNELIQFGEAVQIDARRWRLSRLLRGRRGTEAAAGLQAAGDRFVLIERDSVRSIDLPASMLGGAVRVMASGVGDGDGPVAATVAVSGSSVLPPSPVHLVAGAPDDSGAVTLDWVRRSRAGWRWIDGGDAPLGEESERYRVVLTLGDGSIRTIETGAPTMSVTGADRAPGAVHAAVRQIGTLGESGAAAIVIS